jgi:hypothetical protein
MKSGIYETIYGNACEYFNGDNIAYDLDMAEDIPIEMIDFDKFIRSFDDD